jgi:acyl carrier protein
MERKELLAEINKVFVDILDNDLIVLSEETSADDIEEWDSLTHVQLVVAVEKHFKIRFTSREIQSWKNIGEMIQSVESKLKQA